uniref:Cyclin n=1 Tax=Kalanchoe fedtschenkoi TaxID=63787 RepID=A0A7N0TM92_KALFE
MSIHSPPTVYMGRLALHEEIDTGSDVYLALGLKEKKNGTLEKPPVLEILSILLERIAKKNEMLAQSKVIEDVMTDFHGIRAPEMGVEQYLDRLFRHAACSPSCFVAAFIYVDKFLQRKNGYLTSLNVHRLLITSVMVAAKFIDDAFFDNAYYAKVGGISTRELNKLEMKLLFDLDFRLQIPTETFRKYCLMLEKEALGGLMMESSYWHDCKISIPNHLSESIKTPSCQ